MSECAIVGKQAVNESQFHRIALYADGSVEEAVNSDGSDYYVKHGSKRAHCAGRLRDILS